MAEKHKLKSLKRKIQRNAKITVLKKIRQYELQERCGLTNDRPETDKCQIPDTYWGNIESDGNLDNLNAALEQEASNQTNDDNNIVSGEDSDDNESNYSEDTNCTVNNSSVHSSSSNSDSEYNVNVNVGNDNPRNCCCHFKAFCGTASQG